jgi:uroporphyrinogen decarboxylase
MNHRERIESAIQGQWVDRVPLGFWRHYPNEDRAPRRLAEGMFRLQKELDLDFIKHMPYGLYSVVDWGVELRVFEGFLDPPINANYAVKKPEDWLKLKAVRGDSGEYAVVLESQRLLLSELKDAIPVVQTVFSPLTSALKLAGQETLRKHLQHYPEKVHAGLEVITETTRQFAKRAVEEGADGVFYATQMSNRGKLTLEQHRAFVRNCDLAVLNEITHKSWFNIVHLHGAKPMIEEFLDYPVQAFNWHDRDEGPSLSEVRKLTDKCLMGGIGHDSVLLKGKPEEVAWQMRDAVNQLQGRGLILAPGCGAGTRTPPANVLALRESVKAGLDA